MDTSSPKNFNIYFEFIIFLNEFKNEEGMEEVLPWKEKTDRHWRLKNLFQGSASSNPPSPL